MRDLFEFLWTLLLKREWTSWAQIQWRSCLSRNLPNYSATSPKSSHLSTRQARCCCGRSGSHSSRRQTTIQCHILKLNLGSTSHYSQFHAICNYFTSKVYLLSRNKLAKYLMHFPIVLHISKVCFLSRNKLLKRKLSDAHARPKVPPSTRRRPPNHPVRVRHGPVVVVAVRVHVVAGIKPPTGTLTLGWPLDKRHIGASTEWYQLSLPCRLHCWSSHWCNFRVCTKIKPTSDDLCIQWWFCFSGY